MSKRLDELILKASKKIEYREWCEDTGCFGSVEEKYELDQNLLAELIVKDCCKLIVDIGIEQFDLDNARLYNKAIRNQFGLPDEWPFG